MKKLLVVCLSATAIALCGVTAPAQSVPLVSGDLDVGAGSTSARAGDVYFRTTNTYLASADLAIRIGGAGKTRPVVVLGYSFGVFGGDYTTDCALAPNGSCKGRFPNTYGPSVGVGLRQILGQRGMVGVAAGVASYDSQARFAEVDASWRLVSHLAVVTELRYIDLSVGGSGGAHAWFLPLTLGARLYW
jgi:hypothetical protein